MSQNSVESVESVTSEEKCSTFIPSVVLLGLWGFDQLFNIYYFFF